MFHDVPYFISSSSNLVRIGRFLNELIQGKLLKKFLIIWGNRFVIIYREAFFGEELIACEYG